MGDDTAPYVTRQTVVLDIKPTRRSVTVAIFIILFVLVLTGLFKYLPRQLVFMQRRAVYYLWGHEADERLGLQLFKKL